MFGLPGVRVADVTADLARSAAAMRAVCFAERPKRKLKTPDAVILATAARHADALYTGDKKLLKLAGRSFLGDLTVAKPPASLKK